MNWFNNILECKNSFIPRVSYNSTPLMPQEIFKEINASVTPDTILTADVGLNQMWAAHFYDSTKPRTFITSGGLGTMGFGFPAAIGAKVAMPDNPVLSIVGDGDF